MTGAPPISGASMRGCVNGSTRQISSARGARSTPWPGTKPSCFRCWKCQGTGRSSFLTSCIRITPRIRSMTPRSTAPCNNNVEEQSAGKNAMIACRGSLARGDLRGKSDHRGSARSDLPAPNTLDTAHVRRNSTASGLSLCGHRTSSWLSPKMTMSQLCSRHDKILRARGPCS
jgi:hypothetical protein